MSERTSIDEAMPGGLTYSIGEAAQITGISTATIRLYERQGLLNLGRTRGGHRILTENDLNLLKRIRVLRRTERRTGLEGIRQALLGSDATPRPQPPAATTPQRIGPRLRAFRHKRGLTLMEVAASSGLSHSFLSALERGATGISANNLRRVLHACGTNMIELFSEPNRPQRKLILPGERPGVCLNDGGVLVEDLAVGPRQMEIQLWTIQHGAESDGSYSHPGEEAMYMLLGELDVCLNEREDYHLTAGACLYFPSSELHRWRNNGSTAAVVLWVNTPPTF